MNALFVANIELAETEGIYKKVVSEATAIGKVLGECDLVTKYGKKTRVKKSNGDTLCFEQPVLDFILDCIDKNKTDFLYIRHMIPSPKLISVLSSAKKKGIRIYYEIPTYPYYGEQFKASRHKYRAVIKIGLDVIFWPLIYQFIDKLVVIRSSTKARHYPKMIEITNGVRVDNIQSKSYSENEHGAFRMVAVGTLYPYHGYDRILKGMVACGERVDNTQIEFHIVGSSQTIDDLHRMADDLNLHNVFFHGVKTTEELNEMYEQFDVGLGCLALHRRNADIDTTLKVIEYYCRGLPVVTSGKCPSSNVEEYTIFVDDSEEPLSIPDILNDYKQINVNKKRQISMIAREIFSWDSIMTNLIKRM